MAATTLDLFATEAQVRRGAVAPGKSRVERTTHVLEGVAGVRALEPVWRGLSAAARDQSVFCGFGFALAGARYHASRGERVVSVVAEWNGRPACVLPVAVTSRAGVAVATFLGDPLAQYGDALMAANAPGRIAELALERLSSVKGVDVFEFRRVRSDAAIAPALARFARRIGPAAEAPHADLAFEPSIDAYLLAIGGAKQRRERVRSRRRLEERGAVVFETFRGPDAISHLRAAFALKGEWLARQGAASPVIGDPLALATLERFACDERDGEGLVVGRLSVGAELAAYEVGLVKGRRFHAFLGVVAEPFAVASPGKIAMEETLRWCRANGVDLYDLLPPGDVYKRRWSNGSVEVRSYVAPVTRAGRLYCGPWLSDVRPRLRAALDGLPGGLRRTLGAVALKAGAR